MLSLRSSLCLSIKLLSFLILFSFLFSQGQMSSLAEAGVPEATPVAATMVEMDFGEGGYNGPVYWDTFPETFQVISSKDGSQEIIPGPSSQVRLLVQLQGEPIVVYQQRLQRTVMNSSVNYAAALKAYSGELQTARQQLLMQLDTLGVTIEVKDEFSYLFNGIAISASEEARSQIVSLPQVVAVFPDYQVEATLNDSVPLIGAPQVWAMSDTGGNPVDGTGMRIAIIDTGVDYTHPDLGGCFGVGCRVVGGYDFVNDDADPFDDCGHGTHVAGIVAANGVVKGVAPAASLLAYKVLNAVGSGSNSDIIAAVEAAANPDGDPATDDAVDVINMSLSGPGNPDSPFSQAVDHAVDLGIVVVVSAGNDWNYFMLGAPASARKAITVAASDKDDRLADFSSRGPIGSYLDIVKPDVTAPGVAISSTVPSLGVLGDTTGYNVLDGTSMAAPHVAGAAALLRQLHPDWSPGAIKASLMNTALDIGEDIFSQGTGRIQVNQAITTTSLVSPGAISFGQVNVSDRFWNSQRVIEVTNVVSSSLHYTLTAALPLPQGVSMSISPATFLLAPAANQQVTLTLTVDNDLVPYGLPPTMSYEALLKLQSGSQSIRIPYVFTKSSILWITFEEELPEKVYLHDRQIDFQIIKGGQVLTDTFMYLHPGTYDVIGSYYTSLIEGDALVFREGVAVDGITHITMRRSDAKHEVSIKALDVNGEPLPLTHESAHGWYMSGWSYKPGTIFTEMFIPFGNYPFPPIYHLSDVSDAYFFSERIPIQPPDRLADYYEVFVSFADGLSSDTILQNDPDQFRTLYLDLQPDIDELYSLSPIWTVGTEGSTMGVGGSSWGIPSLYKRRNLYLPLMEHPFLGYYTAFDVAPDSDWFDKLYKSVLLHVSHDLDSIQLSTGFDPLPDIIENNLMIGGAPLHWSSRFQISSSQLILNEATLNHSGYLFDQGMNHVFTSPFTYTLSSVSDVVTQGEWPSRAGYYAGDQKSLDLPEPGAYTMTIAHSGYSLDGQIGQGLAIATFDTTRTDPNPPYLLTLNVVENGFMTDTVSTNGSIRFSLSDDVSLAQVMLSLKLGDGDWNTLPLTKDGDFYVASLSGLNPETVSIVSLQIVAQDDAGNTFSYEASPGFILIHPSTLPSQEIYLPLVVR